MAEKRRRAADGETDSGDRPDPLGEVVEQYHVTWASVLLVSGAIAVVGLGCSIYAVTREPWSKGFLLVGGAVVLCAVALLIINSFSVGRRLELRRRGLRLVERGVETEVLWGDIVDIEVGRTDATYMGPVSVERRSSDPITPSGPLTKTEWQVTIHTSDGRSLRLSKMFLRMVPDPKKLISHLRMRSGMP
jgi:hypothetical protein